MSFRHLIDEMAANEKHPMWSVFDGLPGLDPRPKKPLRKAIGISADWTKAFFDAHRRAMSATSIFKRGEYSAMIKAIRQDQAVELAALRKSHAVDQHRAIVERHAAFGAKIDAAIKAKEITALQASTLESRWHHNGRALEQAGRRLGVLR